MPIHLFALSNYDPVRDAIEIEKKITKLFICRRLACCCRSLCCIMDFLLMSCLIIIIFIKRHYIFQFLCHFHWPHVCERASERCLPHIFSFGIFFIPQCTFRKYFGRSSCRRLLRRLYFIHTLICVCCVLQSARLHSHVFPLCTAFKHTISEFVCAFQTKQNESVYGCNTAK